MKPKVERLMKDRIEQNQEIVTHYLNAPAFQAEVLKQLVPRVYTTSYDVAGEPRYRPVREAGAP